MPLSPASCHSRIAPAWRLAAATVALAACAAVASATVMVKEKSTSSGFRGWGAGTTTSTMTVVGDKQRSESEFVYTGKLKTLVGRKPVQSVDIVRLDKELMWDLDPANKSYTETTFAELRKLMAEGAARLQEPAPEPAGEGEEAPEMTFTLDVKRTGAKKEINGFPTEQAVVTCIGKPVKPEKGQENAEVRIVLDLWLTKQAPGQDELQDFHRRFAEKIGMDPELERSATGMVQKLYGGGMRKMAEEMKKLEGVPILSTLSIESQQMATAEKGEAAAQAKAARTESEEAEKQGEEEAVDAAKSGDARSAVSGLLGGKLKGMMAKKRAEKKEAQAAAPADAALFRVTTEVLSISTGSAPGVSFDPPADFKKVERPKME
jgi:hypothetical protein